jgi:phosphoribosylamine---glycine ligase
VAKKYKILVIGNGGREHAIINQIKKSPLLDQIFCSSQNAGISQIADDFCDISPQNHEEIIRFCHNNKIDLVIIGPEQPLVEGLADSLQKANIKTFGPSKAAARLEGSKAFTKEICDKYDIATAKYQAFESEKPALEYLQKNTFPCVIKADGIAAGKGVIIAQNKNEAENAVKEIFGGKFGNAGASLIIEEFLEGVEASFFAICDGENACFLGTAGDHKKVGEGETGPNTGGMGTYSPSPFVNDQMQDEITQKMIKPTMQAMKDLGCPFVGILFAGLILTKNGPQLLEYNVRFGDPETQSLLPRLKTDLLSLIIAATEENLANKKVEFLEKSAVCVVMATKGYPDKYEKGSEIKNLQQAENCADDVIIFHAGTKIAGDKILANGGRVLCITALGDNFAEAKEKSYKAVNLIDWGEGFYRRDIASKAVNFKN